MTPAPTILGRLWRWTKRLSLVTTLLVVAAVPAVGFGLPLAARTRWARVRMEKALTRSMGTPIQIGGMSWSWKQGLTLQELSTASKDVRTSFRIDRVQLQPRLSKLAAGKLRVRATVENPQFFVAESGSPLRLPRFPKKGLRIEKLDLVNASVTMITGGEVEPVLIEDLTVRGTGRLENRALRFEVASVSGRCDGVSFSGQGAMRLSQEGLSGQIGMNEVSATESAGLQKVLRALRMAPKAPVLSEPF